MISVDEKSNRNLSAMRRKLLGDFELVYVPLNRKVSWVSNNIWVKKNSSKEGVDSVQVAENYLISYRSFIKNIEQRKNEATKEKMIDIFSEPIEFDLTKFYSLDKIEEFRIQYRKEFDEKIIKNIDKLFEQYEINKIAFEKRMSSGPSDAASSANSIINYQLSLVQLYKINEILNYIKEEFDWLHKKRADLDLIITNINSLFKDTNKTLFIDDERNCLFFRNNTDSKKLEITHLSSGEKQLLMFYIFSMATFTNKKGNSSVVLFDEPELSLHIEWQEKLLSSIKKNNSLKQIIIATHSPDLIGEYVSNCVEVVGKDG
ncbi:AAA family ATPase [Exiguobacterium mexicanum]|uniref:AAA family ATPase n=1 Tax=Exiguobacterium mexicanum TaxID=340146 RepID=UPI0037C147CB